MEETLYLPTLSHWEYGNPWSGERGRAHFLIKPGDGVMNVEMWIGPMSREFAQVELTGQFPVSDEGIEQMRAWILDGAKQLNGCQ